MALLLGGMLCMASAQATIVGTSGDVWQIVDTDVPFSVAQGEKQDNWQIYAFDEKTITLGDSLTVDWLASSGNRLNSGGGIIASGTRVQSHFLHFDPDSWRKVSGTIEFSDEILGVIFTNTGLNGTDDLLGDDDITYGKKRRKYEGNDQQHSFLDNSNNRLLTLTNWAGANFMDQARVITAAPVPVPAALWLFGSGILAILGIRRKRCAAATAAA